MGSIRAARPAERGTRRTVYLGLHRRAAETDRPHGPNGIPGLPIGLTLGPVHTGSCCAVRVAPTVEFVPRRPQGRDLGNLNRRGRLNYYTQEVIFTVTALRGRHVWTVLSST